MTKRQVNICDVCNENIAEGKCDLCGKDFCGECFSVTQLFLSVGGYSSLVFNIKSCKNCNNNIAEQNKEGFWNGDIKKNLFNKIIPYLKRKIMTHKLKGEETKPKPRLTTILPQLIPQSIVSPRQIFPQTNPWTPFKPQNITPVTPADKRIFKKYLKKFYKHLTGRKELTYYDESK